MKEKGCEVIETDDLVMAASKSDLVYMTRIQKERFADLSEYEKVKGSYIIDREFLDRLKKKITILHPLPRVDEISPEVDSYPGAAYFRQMRNGVFVRMALLAMILGKTVILKGAFLMRSPNIIPPPHRGGGQRWGGEIRYVPHPYPGRQG